MKSNIVSLVRPACLVVVLCAVSAGCTRDGTAYNAPNRRRIPLAPVGAVSPGIGGPGGNSADTRATGTIASGEGDSPIGVNDPASAPVVAPGVAPGTGTAGVHGGRF